MRKRILISIGLIFSIHLIASEESYAYETLAEDLSHPWGLAVIDEKNIIFTELSGNLRIIENGKLNPEPLSGVPEVLLSLIHI